MFQIWRISIRRVVPYFASINFIFYLKIFELENAIFVAKQIQFRLFLNFLNLKFCWAPHVDPPILSVTGRASVTSPLAIASLGNARSALSWVHILYSEVVTAEYYSI
jgi:hypothetical protein